jgi:type I restriction enzyme S subunit
MIDPKLLPFFLHSDRFMHRAVDISVGSLSPTINWTTLKTQEFLLPPKDQQAKLAELLWAADAAVESEINAIELLHIQKKSLFKTMHLARRDGEIKLRQGCSRTTSGGTPPRDRQDFYNGEIDWVKTKELKDRVIYFTEEKITHEGLKQSSAKLLPKNTILLAMYGATVGKLGILGKEMTCNQASCAIIPDEKVFDTWFLFYYLFSIRQRLITLAVGSAQPNISATIIKNLKMPALPLNDQRKIANKLRSIDEIIEKTEEKLSITHNLLKSIINQIF